MPKINQEEYEVLKGLDDKWKWIARDEDGDLYAYDVKPERLRYMWFYECGDAIRLAKHEHLFRFIRWSDKEPYSIPELIEEYEDYQYTADWHAEQFDKLSEAIRNTESEEIEVKDKKWLQDSITKVMQDLFSTSNPNYFDFEKANKQMRELINQLDEPEVLTSDWIKDNQLMWTSIHDGAEYYVPANKLYGKIVPKQEELESKIKVLIEAYKQEDGAYSNPENGWIGGFIEDLKNLVEKEQKYYVKIMDKYLTDKGLGIGTTFDVLYTSGEKMGYQQQFTEQEIKDYDERFWPFAVPVVELEE